ncbi:phosphopantetheine-binding protein [Aquibacillus sp. 3ASR75-11]|uniref:Phosphopantetheine-binding protein n=1 Tax=Terrihalobacillus insolitus TaxID=2950438 RepID=A0A9X3WU78_9BACI|nr:phosphopantetheine-binding protein [Terrihalobacillus insolitus]MDC3414983.1 phosphopantetheine-binding protein [Terrihalobacillus insolitus]MDC3425882.1 phosphopantetheine-binding protein [Terrihalobacillus insolitus]
MRFDQFCTLISDIAHIPPEKIQSNSTFRDDLGIDSLQMVNLFIELSEQTGVGFDHFVKSEDIQTVGGVYQQVIYKGENQ